MNKYSIIYFLQQIYVENRFPAGQPSLSTIYAPQYVCEGGYTSHIENSTLFTSDGLALKSIPDDDTTTYLIQHVYKHG
jgi:hypothetical protein